MRKGFIFNAGKCVKCNACSAACTLYNGWGFKPRNIYTFNENLLPGIAVVNISLACNHCDNPACMDGCPSDAYYRDTDSGAVLIDKEKCLGCKYCQWNCPYDAPKFDEQEKIIVKCNLCFNTLSNGSLPACSTACPTGALSYGEIREAQEIIWLPSSLKPGIEFTGNMAPEAVKVTPAAVFSQYNSISDKKINKPEWSLLLFSFLVVLSVSTQAASFFNGIFPGTILYMLAGLAAIISLFHLGKPARAIKSLKNIRHSPLSREILFFLLFAIFSVAAREMQMAELAVAAMVAGIALLLIIDSVYARADKQAWLHSGQAFLSGLLLISYFTESLLPFTFIVLVKTILTARQFFLSELIGKIEIARFFKAAVLLIVSAGLLSGYANQGPYISVLIIVSEFIDRILFYVDFEPENIRNITRILNSNRHEKKRG